MNALKIVGLHWKKTVFAVCVSAYGLDYVKGKFEEWNLMKEYCLEAKRHGQMPVSLSQPRKVAVILNPASNKGSGRETYKKKVGPLLHLAGLDVELILTKHEGHGKQIMSELEQTSAVVIAAGDGTVSEVVTGLMKRHDEQVFSQTPICVVPLGRTNTMAHLLHPTPPANNAQFIGEMVMAMIDAAALKYVDVFSAQAGEDKRVYGVGSVSIGAFTDSQIKRNSWYHRLMSGRVGYLLTSLFGWQDMATPKDAIITFSNACQGCSNCWKAPLQKPERWWKYWLGGAQKQTHQVDYASITNEDCNKEHYRDHGLTQLDLIANVKTNCLIARFIDTDISPQDFRKLGLERGSKMNQNDKVQEQNISSLNLELPNLVCLDSPYYNFSKLLSVKETCSFNVNKLYRIYSNLMF